MISAYIYEEKIDKNTYDEQYHIIECELESSRSELQASQIEDFDAEGLTDFACAIIERADVLWIDKPVRQKRILQKAIFPDGLQFNGKDFGTVTTSYIFNMLRELDSPNAKMASPRGFEPLLPP